MSRDGPKDDPRQRLIYVGGYGRSGSTLISRVLDQSPDILNLGEVANVARYFGTRKGRCTCGKRVAECPVWMDISARVDIEPTYGVGPEPHRDLLRAAQDTTGDRILLDSSKTPPARLFRPFFLLKALPGGLLLIHQIRDPRAVAWSHLRERPESPPLKKVMMTLKVALSWAVSNLACDLFRLRHPRQYVRLLYEKTVREGVPSALHAFVEPGPLAGRVLTDEQDNHHAPTGNKMRRSEKITIAVDDKWRRDMPGYLKFMVLTICFPQMLAYGFFASPAGNPDRRS